MKSGFINFWKELGFSLPSSRFLSRKMVSLVDKHELKHIIELGSGRGALTHELIRSMPRYVRIDLFEVEKEAVEHLIELYGHESHVHIHHMSAVSIHSLFDEGSVDAVISTLPLGSIDKSTVHDILSSISHILKPNGQYIQYQYWMVNRKDVLRYFDIEKTHIEARNYGPAFIYHAKKKKI